MMSETAEEQRTPTLPEEDVNSGKRPLDNPTEHDEDKISVPKRKKLLPHEKLFVDNLPCADSYEKSYMHRDTVTHCIVSATDFIITASCDGHIKFWKKMETGIEFVKHFRSHLG